MAKLSFEEKIKKSKEILDKLMDPEITLEDSVKFYKEGLKELQEAQKLLEKAKITFEEFDHDKDQTV
jgi:exodeoxyribonuclease VII small subunit